MATANIAYRMFNDTINQVIKHWEMDGEVTKFDDFRNYLIHFVFRFRHQYLSVHDVITFEPNCDKRKALDDTVAHINEIRKQFNYYFNAIWC
jgi:hypothetical protein